MTEPSLPILLDTDVIIDYLRGRSEAVAYLEALNGPLFLSVITVAELYAGVREGRERVQLDLLVSAFTVIPIDQTIAITGGLYRREYSKSHGTGLADALIAATAVTRGLALVTLNKKHFPMVPSLIMPY